MRYAIKSFWILFFLSMALILGHCGRLSNSTNEGPQEPVSLEDIIYIPEGWNGEEDWSSNAFLIEDITP
jgi:hypothetical protein